MTRGRECVPGVFRHHERRDASHELHHGHDRAHHAPIDRGLGQQEVSGGLTGVEMVHRSEDHEYQCGSIHDDQPGCGHLRASVDRSGCHEGHVRDRERVRPLAPS